MTKRTQARTGIARYQQVYTVLSQALAEGTIAAGEALPSEPTLVRRYGVSRTTVRRALARLASEGSIVRRRGSGTFAREPSERSPNNRKLTRVLNDLQRLDETTISTLLEFAHVPTPEFLRRETPEFGENVLLVRRLRAVNDVPVILATSYVPERLAPLLNKVRLRKTTILVTLDRLGHSATTAEQQTTAVAAEPYVARHLKCPVGAPLLNVRMLTRDQHGHALDFTSVMYRPDSYEVRTRIERPTRARMIRSRRSP